MFVGTHERALDEKGRLSLPATFKNQLGDRCYLAHLEGLLFIYSEATFTETVELLEERVRAGEATQDDKRRFGSSVHELRVDKQGRVVLPSKHRDQAELATEVVLIGALNRIEIYRPDSWTEVSAGDRDGAGRAGSWL